MRVRSVVVVSLLFLGACSREPEAPAVPAAQIQGSLNQVMRGILFPNSNIIFDAQDKDPAAEPDPNDPAAAAHPFAGTYGGWEAVENASIALYEAANLVQIPDRKCQNGKPIPLEEDTFQKGLAALREASMNAYKVAQSKNADGMLDVADKLTQACSTCHDVYRDRIVDGKPIGMEQRCSAS
jgi:hypothetical protein